MFKLSSCYCITNGGKHIYRSRYELCVILICRFYAEYASRKKLCEKSDMRYNYVQMPDDLTVLDNGHLRAPVDPRHVRQSA